MVLTKKNTITSISLTNTLSLGLKHQVQRVINSYLLLSSWIGSVNMLSGRGSNVLTVSDGLTIEKLTSSFSLMLEIKTILNWCKLRNINIYTNNPRSSVKWLPLFCLDRGTNLRLARLPCFLLAATETIPYLSTPACIYTLLHIIIKYCTLSFLL